MTSHNTDARQSCKRDKVAGVDGSLKKLLWRSELPEEKAYEFTSHAGLQPAHTPRERPPYSLKRITLFLHSHTHPSSNSSMLEDTSGGGRSASAAGSYSKCSSSFPSFVSVIGEVRGRLLSPSTAQSVRMCS